MNFQVIGIEGASNSGKDTIADWFTVNDYCRLSFADPLKRFAAQSFGFTKEALWGPSKLRNEMVNLSEDEWFTILGRLPRAANEFLNGGVLKPGVKTTGYLKLMDWFTALKKANPEKVSARIVLQTLGTEWGRQVDPDMWVDFGYESIHQIEEGRIDYNYLVGRLDRTNEVPYSGVVVPDHRFANEIQRTQRELGFVIRVKRLSQEADTGNVGIAGHQSELERKSIPDEAFNLVIEAEEFPDMGGFSAALDKALEEEPWHKGMGTVVRLAPLS